MKLITNNKRQLPQLSNEQWAVAIRNKYGSTQDLFRRFSVDRASKYDLDFDTAIETQTPSLVRLTKSYGVDTTTALMELHITSAIITMGEEKDVEPTDVKFVAFSICQSEKLRQLNMASILSFFHRLKCGEFEIYGKITPRKIMEKLNKYADVAIEREQRAYKELNKKIAERVWAEHQAQSISFDEYKKLSGIDEQTTNPLEML